MLTVLNIERGITAQDALSRHAILNRRLLKFFIPTISPIPKHFDLLKALWILIIFVVDIVCVVVVVFVVYHHIFEQISLQNIKNM